MYTPSFRLRSFESIPDEYKFRVLSSLLDALTVANIAYLRTHAGTPLLYQSGVRYVEEPPGRDEWQDIPDTLLRREGDCEDLACYRLAELLVGGETGAKHHITVDDLRDARGEVVTTFHISIIRGDGTPEDPSRLLGMT